MEQKIIPVQEHQLPIQKVDTHAIYVVEKLKSAGFVAYLVGGSVRDLLLGRRPKDFDISTSAKPEEIKQVFRNCILIGRRFRLAHIRFGKKVLEVATFRAGDPDKEELILRDNQWGYPEEDALRRDFTINGLFYDPSNEQIIDYVGGYEDIKKNLLRSIGQPYVRFKQDPVRMLRLLKFQARFGLKVDPDAHIALVECKEDIVKSSPARVLEEILRMLESGAAHAFIQLLNEHGMMSHLIPEIAHFIEKEEEGKEIYSYLKEIDRFSQDPEEGSLQRSLLLSSMAFPLLQKRIKTQFLERERIPHLGQIQNHTRDLVSDLFQEFLLLPRRLRYEMQNVLLGQFRLTPLHKKAIRKRIPKDSDFHLAIKFLELRSCLEPGLKQVHEEWHELYSSEERPEESAPRRRRKRPRKRKRKST
ncbi:MAG: polynucleotide adenylyltransferase PcnB [Simkaniaceae bacterium]|nr:polynucleotide adenylyltransferase PcnB [Candidatus Sacchlamyda saccharinae]